MNTETKISRTNLIAKCDEFLADKIDKTELENYAWNLITDDNFEWDDDIISDIIFQWDNESINYPINKINVGLWKHRLKTDEDLLNEYNFWDSHIDRQKTICEKYESKWNPINKKLMVGCSTDLLSDPINGLRHPKEGITTGWYIWSGEWSDNTDFFKPICAEHLLQEKPELIKYLGLDVGFRFLIGKDNYEDVWYDEKLKNV